MLRRKIARRMKGGAYALRRGWNQFRTMSGAGPRGANVDELGQALKYYGMPVSETKLTQIFQVLDKNDDGVVDFDEFREAVLEGPKNDLVWIPGMSTMLGETGSTFGGTSVETNTMSVGKRSRDLDLDDAIKHHEPVEVDAHEGSDGATSALPPKSSPPVVPRLGLEKLAPLMPGNFHKSTHSGAAKHKVPVIPVLDAIREKVKSNCPF